MNEEDRTGSSGDERVIALTPVQLGAVVALFIAVFLVLRALRRRD